MRTITFTRSLLPAALATLSALTLAACAGDDGVVDELAAEDLVDQEDSKADGDGTYTYYTMSADARRCAYPFCGGIFVDRVNRSTTRCSDGSYAEACYAPELDWTESGLSQGQIDRVRGALPAGIGSPAESTVLVRGRMTARDFDVAGTTRKLGVFVVTEAWLGLTADLPDGVFVKVADAGVRCIAAPCESQSERKLNSSARAMIAGIGADDLGLTEAQSQAVVEAQFNGGAIVSGARARVTEGGQMCIRDREKAARGAGGLIYPWGNGWDPTALNSAVAGPGDTVPVGSHRPGGDWAVLDLAGNVFQWTSTPWPIDAGAAAPARAVKGSAWDDHAGVGRGASIHGRPRQARHVIVGFRCAGPVGAE